MTAQPHWMLKDPGFAEIWTLVEPYTMTSIDRGYALYRAVNYLCDRPVPGNIVESGVWRAGSSMLIALTLLHRNETDRDLYLFDTFGGMPEPTAADVDLRGTPAAELLERDEDSKDSSVIWAIAGLDEVSKNITSTGYPNERLHLIKGDVRETAPATRTGPLALLRLDTDWYSSTSAELAAFYPRLVQHGVMIVDDYGHWQGSRKAVDEYFAKEDPGSPKPVLLNPIDYTGRLVVRSEPNVAVAWSARSDQRPAELNCPDLLPAFPNLVDTDPATSRERSLRRTVPHIWRTDRREPSRSTGVLSTEEAAVLYAVASTRKGRRGIEIGSHFGWSTAHLLEAGIDLDAVDPAFGDPTRLQQVEESLLPWSTAQPLRLWPGYSPHIVDAVAAVDDRKFGFAFVDGLHDNEGPRNDVLALEQHLAEDAIVVFHDLVFEDVAEAVRLLASKGWNIRIYNTMQVMAAAWRGGESPPVYDGDPTHNIALPLELASITKQDATTAAEGTESPKIEPVDQTRKNPQSPKIPQTAPAIASVAQPPSPPTENPTTMEAIWEDQISLNSRGEVAFTPLGPASSYRAEDAHPTNWEAEIEGLDAALARDHSALPETTDREGYYGPHHYSYWASGLRDMNNLLEAAERVGTPVNDYLDFGCASGRVLRHFAAQKPEIQTYGCDINRSHIEWVTRYLPPEILTFQNTSIPNLPLADNSIDLMSAFSVFTHIEALDTTWLMELNRILRPGGLLWATVHSEQTWLEMDNGWPLYNAIRNHPEFDAEAERQPMAADRVVLRWKQDRSYSSNVFYTWNYIDRVWGRIFDVVETHRRLPGFQDVVVLRKR